MAKIITMIMAGGAGTRLYPLTKLRSKPAVPIAGKFRLIDIPISNCIHSGLRKIYILTQFASASLHRHIFTTYLFDSFSTDFITILSAQQTIESMNWYQGTADAVRQNLRFLHPQDELILILSGDHLYRMDYGKFINFHLQKKADISISVYPIYQERAAEFGVMKVNRNARIIDFFEKPKTVEDQDKMRVPEEVFQQFGFASNGKTHLASMGIYIFNRQVLFEMLQNTTYEDFGREVIPAAITTKKVYGYFFDGYWEDIGTIKSFFDTHIDLTRPLPRFNFYDELKPIFTHPRFLPGSKILYSEVSNSILCEGSIINRSQIRDAIIGIRSIVGENSFIERSVIMGADFFESNEEIATNTQQDIPQMGIGKNCVIRNAIIDKNARIGNGVRLVNERNIAELVTDDYVIKDGIIVVAKDAIIKDGTVI